ncbi:MAG: MFS transporter [Gammaproteobacteria bacterium]|nr:MFS transporter [Gammaproteobacteria bacterium]
MAQVASVTGAVAVVTIGGIIGRELAADPALATLPVSLLIVGTALCTVIASWTMARIGRARGFALGAGAGALGSALAIAAIAYQDFVLFCAAAALIGCAAAFSQQYRFAAMESVSEAAGPKAVSVVLVGSMLGAVLGPGLAARGESWMPDIPFGGAFAAIAGCYLLAASALMALRPAAHATGGDSPEAARPLRAITGSRLFVVAVMGAAIGQGVMSFVMTAAPLAMHLVDQYSLEVTANIIQTHVLAMYLPSLISGYLITRFGVGRIMLAGAALLGATLAAGLAGRHILHYGAAMVLLGFGWNFLYVGGTALLARTHRPTERFRVQALNDFAIFGIAAIGSLSAGLVMQTLGWDAVLYASLAPVAAVAAAIFWAPPDRSAATAR